ncbi:hypothetical protein [Desulfosporosinus sp.]|uniref:hypothetical protein n=1 Tax=Desulfosporosinus sp. TaxID=157907 RepID=UPI00231A7576|nr:hypothetical protein [Desulfosporosinus sp.]MCO5385107.1 hypothetical protein [Desulfosporosinus sp.]MDA8222217.1 hypothetical protein [Desulfitobacterium hafniense]
MNPNNETCVQRARFIFNYYEKKEWLAGEKPPLVHIIKVKDVQPENLRYFGEFMHTRLNRIAEMMDILLKVHDDWAITGWKDHILMETESFDFNDSLKALNEHGYYDDEFVLKVEYKRKWGVL